MKINLKNIEELIFYNQEVQNLLPEYKHLFDQWKISQRTLGLKSLSQKSICDLLNSLNEKEIIVLQKHFNDIIIVEKINHKLVDNFNGTIGQENNLCQFVGHKDFCITMNKDRFNITFWR
jgi:hypothetical protein